MFEKGGFRIKPAFMGHEVSRTTQNTLTEKSFIFDTDYLIWPIKIIQLNKRKWYAWN